MDGRHIAGGGAVFDTGRYLALAFAFYQHPRRVRPGDDRQVGAPLWFAFEKGRIGA